MTRLSLIAVLCFTLLCTNLAQGSDFKASILSNELERPWGMAFLPSGQILITEKVGRLRLANPDGTLSKPIEGLPEVNAFGQGGLLDVAVHPKFAENRWIYLSFSATDLLHKLFKKYGTEVIRAKLNLESLQLEEITPIFKASPKTRGGVHFGSRLLFGPKGHLFISLGDRGIRQEAQSLKSHLGSLIRLNDDGSVPTDNPFVDTPKALPEIYSYGHRNVQGLALNPDTGEVWAHEHGPQGGDELNRIKPGANYGWPVISYGAEYGSGLSIGEGTEKDGLEQPIHFWDPSIAPSGMIFYDEHLWVGALKYQLLAKLTLDHHKVTHEQHLLKGEYGRIRDIEAGPDGALYLLTDADNGKLIRLEK